MNDITKASLYQQKGNVRETWMDKVKRNGRVKQTINNKVGRGLSSNTPNQLYSTIDASMHAGKLDEPLELSAFGRTTKRSGNSVVSPFKQGTMNLNKTSGITLLNTVGSKDYESAGGILI